MRRTANDELDDDEADDAHDTDPVGVAEGGGVSDSLRALSEMRKRERDAAAIAARARVGGAK